MRKMLVFSRCIAVFILVIVFGAPFVGAGFRDNKAMYFLKREVFVYGVRTEADKVLPKKLPKDITDYYFRTGMQFPAQDYRPYADLIFRCDEKYLSLLIDEAEKNGLIKREPETTFEDFLGDLYYDDSIINNKECLTAYACKYLDVPNYMLYRLDIDVIKQLAENISVVQIREHITCPQHDRGSHGDKMHHRIYIQDRRQPVRLQNPPQQVGNIVAADANQKVPIIPLYLG